MTTATEIKIGLGSIFYRSWGWEQTNVNFYQVVEISPSGKTVKLREVTKRVATMDVDIPNIGVRPKTGVVPVPDDWADTEVHVRRLRTSFRGRPSTNWNAYSYAALWDGTPQYDTSALGYAGH